MANDEREWSRVWLDESAQIDGLSSEELAARVQAHIEKENEAILRMEAFLHAVNGLAPELRDRFMREHPAIERRFKEWKMKMDRMPPEPDRKM
jgi:hypothetical protein